MKTSLQCAKTAVKAGRPMIGLMHVLAHESGLVQVRCRKRSCGLWWYESRKPRKPKLCAGCGNRAGIPWKEG